MANTKSTDVLLMELMAQGLQREQSQEQRDLIYQLYRTAQRERISVEADIKALRSELVAAEEKIGQLNNALQPKAMVKQEHDGM